MPVTAACLAYALVLFAPQVLNDGDTWSHIAVGRWILAQRGVPWTDPFSFSFAGAPWQAHEWLAELLMAAAYNAGGVAMVRVLAAAALALTVGLLAHHLRRWLSPLPATVVLACGTVCMMSSLLVRPHVLALPALELWTAGLVIARGRDTVPSWWLLPVMTVWANLHGGFAFGLALTGPFALEAVLACPPAARWRTARSWVVFIAASFGAAMLTPYGWHTLELPVRLMGLQRLGDIGEWRPMNFALLQPLEIALAALLYTCLTRGIRIPPVRVLLLLGLLHMALRNSRHQMLAGLVGALVVAEPLARGLLGGAVAAVPHRFGRWSLVGISAFAGLTVLRFDLPAPVPDGPTSPVVALQHVPPALRVRPVLNDYAFGGALMFAGIRPFIDARAELYGDAFIGAYLDLVRPDAGALDAVLNGSAVAWTILSPANPLVPIMDGRPGWRRTYADRFAVVHVRDDAGG